MLVVEEIYGGYGDADILKGASVTLGEREIVTIIGPNGAGKSTLLKLIVGLGVQRAGRVMWKDKDVSRSDPEDLAADGLVLIPQTANVFPSLSVEENVQVVRTRRRRRGPLDIWERFPSLARLRKARASTLSGGERQLLAFAKGLVSEPDAILIDEPSGALAPVLVQTVFAEIELIRASGTSILMVEQNARPALRISDRGYVLVDGVTAHQGHGPTLLDDPKVAGLFLPGHEAARVASIQ